MAAGFLVRIMPYRTMEDVIDGVVITFTNLTAAKALEAELREENERLKKLLQAEDRRSKDEGPAGESMERTESQRSWASNPNTLRARMHKLGIVRPKTKESN